jgi:type I restriction enzyme S subunit
MLPLEWSTKNLNSIFRVIDSLHQTPEFSETGGYPMVRVTDVKGGALDLSQAVRVSEDVYIDYIKKYEPKRNDIVFSRVGSYGISSFVDTDESFCLGQNTVIAESNDIACAYYIFCILKSEAIKKQIEKKVDGSSHKTVSLTVIRELKIPVPPLPEQQKIAQILSVWDKAISTTEQLLANSQQQKKALMQQLLTGKKRLLDSNGVRFSGEWITIPLEKLCHINPKRPPEPKDGLVSFIPMEFVSEDAKLLSTSERFYTDVSKGFTSFLDGDILIAKITPCFENGKGCYVQGMKNGVGFGSTEFHVLRANKLSSPLYLYYMTNTSEFRIKGEANMQGSAGQKRVTTDYIKSLKVTLPKQVEEQQKIAAVLSTADQEITTLQQKLAALKQEKKALMQQLLTGKRRVKVEEAA